MLKDIPTGKEDDEWRFVFEKKLIGFFILKGSTFTMRLVEPMKSGFQTIAPRGGGKISSKKGYGSGKETLRFKANGNVAIEDEVN